MNDSHTTVVAKYFAKITILFLQCIRMPLPSGTWSIATIEVALRNGEIYIL